MNTKKLPDVFVSYAADTLAETNSGLTGAQIVKYCNSYAVDLGWTFPLHHQILGVSEALCPTNAQHFIAICQHLMVNSNL